MYIFFEYFISHTFFIHGQPLQISSGSCPENLRLIDIQPKNDQETYLSESLT